MKATTAAGIAVVLFAIYAVFGFSGRIWLQHRRTGSTGFSGINGKIGSPEWLAGVGMGIVMPAAASAPILQWCGIVGPVILLSALWIQVAGIVVATAGIAATVYAQLQMGDSWRIGVNQGETTSLVRTGVFGRVRNPIYTAMSVFMFGIVLLTPNFVAIAVFVLLIATVELQVRRVEEPYLLRTHGEDYRGYTASVGRFIPGIGRTS